MSVSNIETIHNNSKIPDGINVGKAHPLKNFFYCDAYQWAGVGRFCGAADHSTKAGSLYSVRS